MFRTNNLKFNFAPQLFLILLLLEFVSACSMAPVKKEDIKINHNLGITQGLDEAQVIIHMRPEDRKRIYTADNFMRWSFQEGLIIESAAIKTFSKVFQNTKSSTHSKVSNLVITVSGVSFVNVMVGGYTAEAKAVFTLASGEKLGEYGAIGRDGGMWDKINDKNRFEFAYVQAFTEILETFLKDERLAHYFKNGFGVINTANLLGREPMPLLWLGFRKSRFYDSRK